MSHQVCHFISRATLRICRHLFLQSVRFILQCWNEWTLCSMQTSNVKSADWREETIQNVCSWTSLSATKRLLQDFSLLLFFFLFFVFFVCFFFFLFVFSFSNFCAKLTWFYRAKCFSLPVNLMVLLTFGVSASPEWVLPELGIDMLSPTNSTSTESMSPMSCKWIQLLIWRGPVVCSQQFCWTGLVLLVFFTRDSFWERQGTFIFWLSSMSSSVTTTSALASDMRSRIGLRSTASFMKGS